MSSSEPKATLNDDNLLVEISSKLRKGLGDDLVAVVLFSFRARGGGSREERLGHRCYRPHTRRNVGTHHLSQVVAPR